MGTSSAEADEYVLHVLANDYESIDTVRKEACEWAAEEGKTLDSEEAVQALSRLIKAGLVDCYRFDDSTNSFVRATPTDSSSLDDYWYMASASGMEKIR